MKVGQGTETEDKYYECTGTTEVTIEAGSFSCYIIRMNEDDPQGDTYTVDYYSDEVEHTVKRVQYEDGDQTMTMTLISYNYTEGKTENGNGETPGFGGVLLIVALMSLLMVVRKRR